MTTGIPEIRCTIDSLFAEKEYWKPFINEEDVSKALDRMDTTQSMISAKKRLITAVVLGTLIILAGVLLLTLGPRYVPHVNAAIFKTLGGITIAAGIMLSCNLISLSRNKGLPPTKISPKNAKILFEGEFTKRLKEFLEQNPHLLSPNQFVGYREENGNYYLMNATREIKGKELTPEAKEKYTFVDAAVFLKAHFTALSAQQNTHRNL